MQPKAGARHAGPRALVIDDDKNIRTTLQVCLEGIGCTVAAVGSAAAALAAVEREAFDLAFLDLRLAPGRHPGPGARDHRRGDSADHAVRSRVDRCVRGGRTGRPSARRRPPLELDAMADLLAEFVRG